MVEEEAPYSWSLYVLQKDFRLDKTKTCKQVQKILEWQHEKHKEAETGFLAEPSSSNWY